MKKHATRMLAEGAIFIAMAQVLGYIKFYRQPWGGSVTLIMLPIIIYAVRWGVAEGLLAGLVLGIFQIILDPGSFWGWQSFFGDYMIAYMLVGLAGLMHGKKHGVLWGALIGGLGRFLSVFITGATLWAIHVPTEIFGMTFSNPWLYSFVYNIMYILPSLLLCFLVIGLLYKPLNKFFTGADIR